MTTLHGVFFRELKLSSAQFAAFSSMELAGLEPATSLVR